MRYQIILRFFLHLAIITGPCTISSQFEAVFETPQPQRLRKVQQKLTEMEMMTDLTKYHSHLENLRQLSIRNKDQQSLLLCELNELRSYKSLNADEQNKAIEKIQTIIHKAKEKEFPLIRIHALVQMAHMLREFKRLGTSLSYYLQAYELLPAVDTSLLPKPLHAFAYNLGFTFFRLNEISRARVIVEKYLKDNPGLPVTHHNMLLHDLLSQIYLNLELFDSSANQIGIAKEMYLQSDTMAPAFRGWNGIFEGNLAKIHYLKKEYKLAIPGFVAAYRITSDAELNKIAGTFGLLLCDSYLRLGQISKARELLQVIKTIVYKTEDEKNHRDLYRLSFLARNKELSYDQSNTLLDSIKIWNQKLDARMDTNVQILKTMEFETAELKRKEKELEGHIKKQFTNRNLLLGCLGVVLLLGSIAVYRKQIQLHEQRKKSISIRENAERELAKAEAELIAFKDSLIEKNSLIENLEAKQNQSSGEIELQALRNNSILTDADWLKFKELFEKVHSGYLTRLNKQFPDLSAGEIRLIVLIKLSLNNQEMASTLGVGTGAIRTMKSRLLKKLNLRSNEIIEEYFKQI